MAGFSFFWWTVSTLLACATCVVRLAACRTSAGVMEAYATGGPLLRLGAGADLCMAVAMVHALPLPSVRFLMVCVWEKFGGDSLAW